jgi:hypothetical protein
VALEVALEQTDLSSRLLAAWITDNKDFSVSEPNVYRLLKRQGLIKCPEMKMAAGKDGGPAPQVIPSKTRPAGKHGLVQGP